MRAAASKAMPRQSLGGPSSGRPSAAGGEGERQTGGVATLNYAQLAASFEAIEERKENLQVSCAQLGAEEERLNESLAIASQRAERLAGAEQALRHQADQAFADVRVLIADLPPLLEGRRGELASSLAKVNQLTETSELECLEEDGVRTEVEAASREHRVLSDELEAQLAEARALPGRVQAAEHEVKALQVRWDDLCEAAATAEATLRQEIKLRKLVEVELEDLRRQGGGLHQAIQLTRQRHEDAISRSKKETESFVMARQLEINDLRHSLQLHVSIAQGKARETRWWQDRAVRAGHEMEALRHAATEMSWAGGPQQGQFPGPPGTMPPGVPGGPGPGPGGPWPPPPHGFHHAASFASTGRSPSIM